MANGKLEKELEDIQHELIASEVRYRKLFETAKDGILLIDPLTEKVIDANPFLLDMIGYSLDDVIGKKLWEIGAIKDVEESKALFKTLQEKGYAHYEGLPLQSKDGKEHEVEFVSNKYRIDGTKMIQCNIRDITDRKAAEKKAAIYLMELEDELNFNHLITETTTCGVLIYNVKSGKCVFANDAVAKEVGGKKEQLLQQNFREIKAWKVGNLLGAAETAIATGLTQQAEQRVTTSFGKEAYLEAVFATFTKKGEQFLMAIIHDVLKTKRMEEAMAKQVSELEAVNKTMVGRELKMVELKEQMEKLKERLAEK
jgi:PAS domain S-box-containing protein